MKVGECVKEGETNRSEGDCGLDSYIQRSLDGREGRENKTRARSKVLFNLIRANWHSTKAWASHRDAVKKDNRVASVMEKTGGNQ